GTITVSKRTGAPLPPATTPCTFWDIERPFVSEWVLSLGPGGEDRQEVRRFWTHSWKSPMWCSLGTSTPPLRYARESIAGWQRSQASKSWTLTRWKSSTERETSLPDSTTSSRNSQSHSTTVRSAASGYIRWKITWSGTRFTKTCGFMVIA